MTPLVIAVALFLYGWGALWCWGKIPVQMRGAHRLRTAVVVGVWWWVVVLAEIVIWGFCQLAGVK